MDPIGPVTLDTAGAVTKPETVPLNSPTIATAVNYGRNAMSSFCGMPAQRGIMTANGIDPIRHFVKGNAYQTGLLAPRGDQAPTASVSAVRASAVLETNIASPYTIAAGNYIELIASGGDLKYRIVFVTGLPFTSTTYNEVYFDSALGTPHALEQLKKFINQTGQEGYDYNTKYDFSGELLATTITANERLRIDAVSYGTAANSFDCLASPANMRFEDLGGTARTNFTGGAAGTGTAPGAGTYIYGYTYIRTVDGAESGLSPTLQVDNGGSGQVTVNWTASSDPTVDFVRIYRTVAGGGIFYRVKDVAVGTTSTTDNLSDSAITGFDATPFDPSLYRTYRAGYPVSVKYLAQYQGRWFGAGADVAAPYSIGAIVTTNGSYTVSVNPQLVISDSGLRQLAVFRSIFAGREFKATANGESYQIISVSESSGTLTLDRPYESASITSGTYEIKDARDPYELYWSEPGYPNNWIGSLKGPNSPDGKGCTGLFAAFGSLIYFTRQNVWRISGNDGLYQVTSISDKCGCISGQSIVMDGQNMYWLGMDGVYAWNGAGDPVNITTPPQQDAAVRGQTETIARINLSHAHRAYGVLDQTKREIRWFVPMDGSRYNNYALVLDTQNAVFSLDTCEDVTSACNVQGPDGADYLLTGDITGGVYQQNLSTSDGCYGIEQVNTVSSSTTRTVTVAGTPFSTTDNGYWGCPVWHVSATGEFVRNCVATNTNNTLTYRRYMTAPAASTQFVLGGILMWIQTGRFDFGDRYRLKIIPAYIVSHEPESDGQYFFFYSYDQSSWRLPTIGWTAGDFTVGNTLDDFGARRRFRVRKQAVFHGYGIACIEPGCSARFGGVTIEVRGPSNLELG